MMMMVEMTVVSLLKSWTIRGRYNNTNSCGRDSKQPHITLITFYTTATLLLSLPLGCTLPFSSLFLSLVFHLLNYHSREPLAGQMNQQVVFPTTMAAVSFLCLLLIISLYSQRWYVFFGPFLALPVSGVGKFAYSVSHNEMVPAAVSLPYTSCFLLHPTFCVPFT